MRPSRVGKRLKERRCQRTLTVREVASRLKKTPGYISRVETRGEIPSPNLLCQFAEVLGLAPEDLLGLAKLDVLERTQVEVERKHTQALSLFRSSK